MVKTSSFITGKSGMRSVPVKRLMPPVAGLLLLFTLINTKTSSMAIENDKPETAHATPADESGFAMLNVLWFKPDGGRETYFKYMKAAGPFVAKYGGKPSSAYSPEANIIGGFDADLVFFVEWPGAKAFDSFVNDPGYQAISHLREEAIRDSLLIRCRKQK